MDYIALFRVINTHQYSFFGSSKTLKDCGYICKIHFELSCTQDFQIVFSIAHKSEKGHNSHMKKNDSTI